MAAVACVLLSGAALAAPAEPLRLKLERELRDPRAGVPEQRPIFAIGDRVSSSIEGETTIEGNAELRRAGTIVRGDHILYREVDDELVATGHVRIVRDGAVIEGERLQLRIDASEGVFQSPSYELSQYNGRGSASRIDFLGPGQLGFTQATYTTCPLPDPDWYLRAESMRVDEDADEGTGRSASLHFKGRKIIGLPWIAFPLGEGRRSGFLAPSFSMNSRTGAEFTVPYYWNIAPNRDMTLYPRLSFRRGLQLGTEIRYLEPSQYGDLRAEYLPSDRVSGDPRYFWAWRSTFTNVGGWSGAANVKGVSDDNYFVDFSRTIVSSAERSLPRDIFLSRGFGDWTYLARMTKWQNILDARNAPPYERMPQFQARHLRNDVGGFDFATVFDATWFSRPLANAPEGLRVVANPSVSYPVLRPGWFVVPRVAVHASNYQLSQNTAQPLTIGRSLPTFSLDGGLVFERRANLFGGPAIQTLEPRLFFVRTPYRDQTSVPVFDSGAADFNFAQLFSTNTFVGDDRIADVNQLTAALVSRVIDPADGAERLRFALGQRIYFAQQRVALPGVTPPTDRRSDVLLAASGEFGHAHSFDSGLQWSVRDRRVPRLNFAWRYHPRDGRILNVGTRFQNNELGQVDVSWRWPVSAGWRALGRVNYSWLTKTIDPVTLALVTAKPGIIESLIGFEYESCCWGARVVLQRYVTAPSSITTTAFFLQFELKGLGRVGSNPFDILRRNIPGYQLPTDRPGPPDRYFGYE